MTTMMRKISGSDSPMPAAISETVRPFFSLASNSTTVKPFSRAGAE
jgi:hypothetical protein